MLRWRLILGAGLIAALTGLCWLDVRADRPGIYLAPLALLAAFLATGEMRRIFAARGVFPAPVPLYLATLLPVVVSSMPAILYEHLGYYPLGRMGWLALGLAAGLAIAFLGEMIRFPTPGSAIANVSAIALSVGYVGGLTGMLIQLRLPPGMELWTAGLRGLVPLLSMIVTVKLSDTCQYAVGRTLGRRKLAPRLSPGKTWEGAIGGIAIATVLSALLFTWWPGRNLDFSFARLLPAAAYALLVSIAGLLGDLAESLLKRDAGVKDSSDWMPGFGGVLDVMDSLLLAAPMAYFCWLIGLAPG